MTVTVTPRSIMLPAAALRPYKAIMAGPDLDLTEDHFVLLALVRDFPGATPEVLAERSRLAVDDVTRLLLELEVAGYIVDGNG